MPGINDNNLDIDVLKALADETRLEIMSILGNQEMNVNDIADRCTVSRPTISHHLQIMKRAEVLSSRKEGKEIYYSVNMYKMIALGESILSIVRW